MASVAAPVAPTDGPDELDRLLDYDDAVEDFLGDVPISDGNSHRNSTHIPSAHQDEDREIQVRKKRAPVPKLDEDKLLSTAGIPKLRKIARSRVKFRGKGHEFSDISQLLNTYQLWLDDLYPRAKFRDGLAMIEKVGHSKRMQVMRKAWLDETKPFQKAISPELDILRNSGGKDGDGDFVASRDEDLFEDMLREDERPESGPDENVRLREANQIIVGDGDSESAQLTKGKSRRRGPFQDDNDESEGDLPAEDELDALLAEQSEGKTRSMPLKYSGQPAIEEDQDELDALLAEQEASQSPKIRLVKDAKATHDEHADFAAEEEVMADMSDMW